MRHSGRRWLAMCGVAGAVVAGQAGAINIVLDYSYDTQGFFNNATAKATLEKAAADFSSLLTDSLGALNPVDDYVGTFSTYGWEYELNFTHPGTGSTVELIDEPIAADEYRIYAGGRNLGSSLGRGGPGGFGYSYNTISGSGSYYTNELADINDTIDDFNAMRAGRQTQGSDFRAWGGAITFNTSESDWHNDWQSEPSSGESDLHSVALHEIAHAVGFGGSLWESLVSEGAFTGAASYTANGDSAPATDPDDSHWLEDTQSTVLSGGDTQEAAMDPDITTGTRKLLTDLDAAGLQDIGWQINPSFSHFNPALDGDTDGDGDVDDSDLGTSFSNYTGPVGDVGKTLAEGDNDGDGDVDDSDLGTSFSNYTGPIALSVPEPASAALLCVAGLFSLRRQGRHGRRCSPR